MKRIVFIGLLAGCIFTTTQAQDTIYIDNKQQWVKKEKAEMYAVVKKKPSILRVEFYTMDGKPKETTHYIHYAENPYECVKEGQSILFYEDGKTKANIIYADGKIQSVKAYYPDGRLQREDVYDQKGNLETSYLYDMEGNKTTNKMPYERQAEFPGGHQALMNAIASTLKYPPIAQDSNIQGVVAVQFVIDKEGKMTDIQIIKSVHPSLDQEAMRTMRQIAKRYTWEPGIDKGEFVRVRYRTPIIFKLK